MALSAADYAGMLAALLPRGPAWIAEPGSHVGNLLAALAEEFARLDARADALVEEADPRITSELLAEYERALGLPTACLAGLSQTTAQRRAAIVSALTATGGQSRAYFIGLAAAAGYAITITEFRPYTVRSPVTAPLYDAEWAHAWQVNSAANTVHRWTVRSRVNEPLAVWGNAVLECLIRRFAPAHTVVLFAYT